MRKRCCGPVSTVPSSLNLTLCSCQDYGFLQQYIGIHEILYCYLEQSYLNKCSCLNPSYIKVFVTHTLYQGGLAQNPYYLINPNISVNSNWVHLSPGKFFQRANPGHPGKFFCLVSCPGAKNDGRIPGGGAKFSQTQRNCSVLNLQKYQISPNDCYLS